MNDLQSKSFGFNYQFNCNEFMFVIVASSVEEAKAMHHAMRDAVFVGEIKERVLSPSMDEILI